jgi:hypothetical protein
MAQHLAVDRLKLLVDNDLLIRAQPWCQRCQEGSIRRPIRSQSVNPTVAVDDSAVIVSSVDKPPIFGPQPLLLRAGSLSRPLTRNCLLKCRVQILIGDIRRQARQLGDLLKVWTPPAQREAAKKAAGITLTD